MESLQKHIITVKHLKFVAVLFSQYKCNYVKIYTRRLHQFWESIGVWVHCLIDGLLGIVQDKMSQLETKLHTNLQRASLSNVIV